MINEEASTHENAVQHTLNTAIERIEVIKRYLKSNPDLFYYRVELLEKTVRKLTPIDLAEGDRRTAEAAPELLAALVDLIPRCMEAGVGCSQAQDAVANAAWHGDPPSPPSSGS